MTELVHVYALKVDPEWSAAVQNSLQEGVGRFGWSYMKGEEGQPLTSADLTMLKSRIALTGLSSLSRDDQARYQSFLLDLGRDDWVVYINVPEWGQCTVARVAGPYYWKLLGSDFNHCFSVDPESVRSFDRNAEIVHPALRARLKLQGRWWRIYAAQEFTALVSNLASGAVSKPSTALTDAALLSREIEPLLQEITSRVQRTHPNYGLERLLELVFKNIPGVRGVTRQGGAGDHGADLIVEFEGGIPHPALRTQHICVVQAKSYEGSHLDTQAVRDIERAFAMYPAADRGLIVSTANSSTKELDDAVEKLRQSSGKQVQLLIGADVARFILQFGGPIFGEASTNANSIPANG